MKKLSILNPEIEALILGCTHYPYYKKIIKESLLNLFAHKVDVVSQDEIISDSLRLYLTKHIEIDRLLSKNSKRKFIVTKITEEYIQQSKLIMGYNLKINNAIL